MKGTMAGTAMRNYLRVRGEYMIPSNPSSFRAELPPRARRIRNLILDSGHFFGTTSACAENTSPQTTKKQMMRNYLRVRGEYSPKWWGDFLMRELPPRARRIRLHAHVCVRVSGTTSACAENTAMRF